MSALATASMIEARRTLAGVAAAVALLAGGGPLAAQAVAPAAPPEKGNVEASAGDLKIIHLWTLDPEAFYEAWAGPTPPKLPTATRFERNQPITQTILYVNCTRDAASNCHLGAVVTITAPDGTPYGEPLRFDALKGPTQVPRNNIGLSGAGMGLTVEDGEQLGRYRVELVVTDHNAGLAATSVVYLEAVEAGTLSPDRTAPAG